MLRHAQRAAQMTNKNESGANGNKSFARHKLIIIPNYREESPIITIRGRAA